MNKLYLQISTKIKASKTNPLQVINFIYLDHFIDDIDSLFPESMKYYRLGVPQHDEFRYLEEL